ISRVEQGIYEKPNKDVSKWASEVINRNVDEARKVTPEVVEQLYKEWQWQHRESVKLNKALKPISVTDFHRVSQSSFREDGIIYYHRIFTQWRGDYWHSSHAFCVDMSLHTSPVAEYEEGATITMPNMLKKVLTELKLIGEGFKTSER